MRISDSEMRKQLVSDLEEILKETPLDHIQEDAENNLLNDEVRELLYFLIEAKNKLTTSVIYRADGLKEPISPKNGKNFQLEELQEIVGGYIEIIHLPTLEKKMVMNEDGKAMELPINRLATEILRDAYATSDIVVGDVLICDNKLMR